MLSHTQDVHTTESPYGDRGAVAAPARDMPTGEPGPVATERARTTGFDLETIGGDDRGFPPPDSGETGGEGTGEGQNTALGTIIALVIVAALIILNLLAGGE